jgi:hypothetical protein
LESLRRGQEAAEERRMMPAYVRGFFAQANARLGIGYTGHLTGIFMLTNVPETVRRAIETYPPALQERLTFDRSLALPPTALGPEAIYLHPDEAVFDAVMTLFLGRYGDEAERGGLFYDPKCEAPYLFVLARIAVVQPMADEDGEDHDDRADDRETLGEEMIGIVLTPNGDIRVAPAHLLLTLEPIVDPDAIEMPGNLADIAAEMTPIETFVLETHGIPLLSRLRSEMEERLPDREHQLMQAYNLRMTEGMEQRRRLKEDVAKGVPAARSKLDHLDNELAGMEDARDAAIAALHEEIERLDLAPVTIYARAIVLPLPWEEAERRRNLEAEAVALKVARDYEEKQGALVEDVSDPNEANGYDLRSYRPDGSVRYIEVKGRTGMCSVQMTANEWRQAANHHDKYWLYAVYHCETDTPRLHRVADPFGRLLATDGGVLISAGEVLAAAEKD